MPLVSNSLRGRVLIVHAAFSLLLIAGLCFWVFARWYPGGLLVVQGGVLVLLIVAVIALIVGPLLTFILFRPEKKRTRELLLDITLILTLQFGTFGYGTWTLSIQRPAYLAFLYDRFFVVTERDVLGAVPPGVESISPWSNGPRPVFIKLSFGAQMEVAKAVYGLDTAPPMALLPGAYAPLSEGVGRFRLIWDSEGISPPVSDRLIRVPVVGRAEKTQAVIDVDKGVLLRIE